jgi:hypothetical protein
MPATRGNQYAKGNKGGRPTKYKPDYAETAQRLCAKCGYTDVQLADWFKVSPRTINEWKLKHSEFGEALRVGKAETDDLVERATVAHVIGYYVDTERAARNGKVKVREWVKGDAHAGIKWLERRRPEQYRNERTHKHGLSADNEFLRFLEILERRELEARNARAIPVIDITPDAPAEEFLQPTHARAEGLDAVASCRSL